MRLIAGISAAVALVAGVLAGQPAEAAAPDGFYVDPDSNPAKWVDNNGDDGRASAIKSKIADVPMARWYGNWDPEVSVSSYVGAAEQAGKLPVLVTYNIVNRDACSGHSGGGAAGADAYRGWVDSISSGIGSKPAVVIIEPDALAGLTCLADGTKRTERTALLKYAVDKFKGNPGVWSYLDAGNAGWVPAGEMAGRLKDTGVQNARGFAVNVSNDYTTSQSVTYANAVNEALGYDAKFAVDTSRNGSGHQGTGDEGWCNPPGRKLGAVPTTSADPADMLIWAKVPGDSDGPCGHAANPPIAAGTFDPGLAMHLINGD